MAQAKYQQIVVQELRLTSLAISHAVLEPPHHQSMLDLLHETPVAAASRAFPQDGLCYTPSEMDAIMAHKFTEVRAERCQSLAMADLVTCSTGAAIKHWMCVQCFVLGGCWKESSLVGISD